MFTLLKSVREYKWVSIITPILKIAEVIMEVLIPCIWQTLSTMV